MPIWQVYEVEVTRKDVTERSRQLLGLGATGIQEDVLPGTLPILRQPWDKGPAPRQPRRVLLRAWFAERPPDLSEGIWRTQPDEDWNEGWKRHFSPIVISDRLTIAAPWHNVPDALLIEPGNAFGTGDHVTTRACLMAIARLAVPGRTLLDVGCGSGILALAGAKLGMNVWGNDLDPDAVAAARSAATLNHLRATWSMAPLDRLPSSFPATYDLVVANLYAEVLADLSGELLRRADGPIVCAGILADRAGLVRTALGGREILVDETDGDWTHLVFGAR